MTEEQAKTATLDELRKWLAIVDGWTYEERADARPCQYSPWYRPSQSGGLEWIDKPHPPTLDGAAKAMPEGWTWDRYRGRWSGYKRIYGLLRIVRTPDTGDEIDDRYRLAVLCRLAEKAVAK